MSRKIIRQTAKHCVDRLFGRPARQSFPSVFSVFIINDFSVKNNIAPPESRALQSVLAARKTLICLEQNTEKIAKKSIPTEQLV